MVLVKTEAEIIRKQMQEKIGKQATMALLFRKNGSVEIAMFYDKIEQYVEMKYFVDVLEIMNKHKLTSMMTRKKILFYRN